MTSAPSCRAARDHLDHARQRLLARGRLGHAHVERPLAGEARLRAHLAHVAHVPADRALADGDDAEPLAARQGRQHAASLMPNTGRAVASRHTCRPGIGVAGDDEGIDLVAPRHQPPRAARSRSPRAPGSRCRRAPLQVTQSISRARPRRRTAPARRRGPWSRPRWSWGSPPGCGGGGAKPCWRPPRFGAIVARRARRPAQSRGQPGRGARCHKPRSIA